MDSSNIRTEEGGALAVRYIEVTPSMVIRGRRNAVVKRGAAKVHEDGTPVAEPTTGGVLVTRTKTGEKRWLVNIRLKGHPAVSKMFSTSHKDAADWRVTEVARIKALIKAGMMEGRISAKGTVPQEMLMPAVFKLYTDKAAEHGLNLSYRITSTVERLTAHPLLKTVLVKDMSLAVIRAYCSHRKNADGCDPSTVNQDYVRINQAIKRCASWMGWGKFNPLDADVRRELVKDKLISQSKKRHRRPSPQELVALLAHFRDLEVKLLAGLPKRIAKRGYGKAAGSTAKLQQILPMADLIDFAVKSAMRVSEITDLRWSDLKGANAVEVWRKDSKSDITKGRGKGKRLCLVPVSDDAMAIIKRQPRTEGVERIFPYKAMTISNRFHAATVALKIKDLRFHDLRHEAISRIAAIMSPTHAMKVSGHKTTEAFMTYVNGSVEEIDEIAGMMNAANDQRMKVAA